MSKKMLTFAVAKDCEQKIVYKMKKTIQHIFVVIFLAACPLLMRAQQLPDPHFENWSDKFKDDPQLKDWHGSNVSQVGSKFTFMFRKEGRTGYCAYVADRAIGP